MNRAARAPFSAARAHINESLPPVFASTTAVPTSLIGAELWAREMGGTVGAGRRGPLRGNTDLDTPRNRPAIRLTRNVTYDLYEHVKRWYVIQPVNVGLR